MRKPPARREKLTVPEANKASRNNPKRALGGGHRLKGHDQFVALTEADQVAV